MSTYDMLDHGPAPSSDEDAVMRDLLRMIMDQIWWVLGIAGCVILAAVIYTKLATPVYSADALLQVDPQNNTGSQTQSTASLMPSVGPMRTDAEIEIIKSRAVVEPVVEQFKLNFSTAAKTILRNGLVCVGRRAIRGGVDHGAEIAGRRASDTARARIRPL